MVTPDDIVLAISNSGESDEIGAILPAIKRLGVKLVAITGGADSSLARHADVVVSSAVDQEACPLNLAPTASTTAQMALGDALAVALLDARGFREEDFARSHPGGSLGRKLLMHVADLMHSGDAVPRVDLGAARAGDAARDDEQGLRLHRRHRPWRRHRRDLHRRRSASPDRDRRGPAGLTASEVMHARPRLIRAEALAVEAADLMEQHRITGLIVVDAEGRLAGC
jgi:arabinose-5-phosphate isomerase